MNNKKKKKKVRALFCKRCGTYFNAKGSPICRYCCCPSKLIYKNVDPEKVTIEENPFSLITFVRDNFTWGECFLTTACVSAIGLPDDCAELQALRRFRDTYVAALPTGPDDIQEYRSIAPKIVSRISSRPNAADLYREIFTNIVRPCVNLINCGQFAEAYLLYKQKLHELRTRFL
ncbi:MAG: CFI-box-CTERM domain-containing protein [Patescibacteria group bacterium]|jgi:hypothetical protein